MRGLLLLLLACPVIAGESWSLPNGKTYEDVEVTKKDADRVTISHSSGVARIAYADLPPVILAKLGISESEATAAKAREDARKADEAASAGREAKLASKRRIMYVGRTIAKHEKGWVANITDEEIRWMKAGSCALGMGTTSLQRAGLGKINTDPPNNESKKDTPRVSCLAVLVDHPNAATFDVGKKVKFIGYFEGSVEYETYKAELLHYIGPAPLE
ncbi:MAG: hypothetical protein ACKO2G_16255 [Verrucomicrobiales bacterium]